MAFITSGLPLTFTLPTALPIYEGNISHILSLIHIFQTEKTLGELVGKLSDADKTEVQNELAKLKTAVENKNVETMTDAEVEEIKTATESLKNAFYKISEELYKQTQAAGGQGAPGADNSDPNVVDGDYKEM